MSTYLEAADVWTILDLIVAEFTSDPQSTQCFDGRIVARAIALNRAHRATADPTAIEPPRARGTLHEAARRIEERWMDLLAAEVTFHGGLPAYAVQFSRERNALATAIEALQGALAPRPRHTADDIGFDAAGQPIAIGAEAGREQDRIIDDPNAQPVLLVARLHNDLGVRAYGPPSEETADLLDQIAATYRQAVEASRGERH